MNRVKFLGFLAFAALGCGTGEPSASPPSIYVAALANDDCAAPASAGLPPEIDAIDIELSETGRGFHRLQRVEAATEGPLLVEGVPTGEHVRLRFVACEGPRARYVATVSPLDIQEDEKHFLTLHFRQTNALSCTGTSFGTAYNQRAALGRARAFPATALLDDGRLLVAGGAATFTEGVVGARSTGAAWDLYNPHESLFLPGVDRAVLYDERPMRAARVGAVALPYEGGALIVGGAPGVTWGGHAQQRGPLLPDAVTLSTPAAEVFDVTTGGFAEVRGAWTPRFMPGADVSEGRPVIAGGLVFTEAGHPEASDALEVVDGPTLHTRTLPAALLGPSVTDLGEGRLLLWGADIETCGASPGWLVTLDPTLDVQPLTIIANPAAPRCEAPVSGCRGWYPTAFHTATRLDGGEGRRRVLITGGVTLDATGLIHNPDQGANCRPNAFVLSIDVAAARAEVLPIEIAEGAGATAKRALHQAARVGDRVLITGGWANEGTPTALSAASSALFYDDASPVGRLAPANFTLSEPRLGHFARSVDSTVVIAGGMARREDTTHITHTATVYVPPAGVGSCQPAQ